MKEAIILAGGFGTRLRQVVPDVPKPMAPINGRPFLEILLTSLARKGFERIVLSLGFMAEKISIHFGDRFAGIELVYAVEETPLGTGGAVRLAMTLCRGDHVFVFNGDTFLDLEVDEVERLWQAHRHTIIVGCEVQDAGRYGRLVAFEGRVYSFTEKGVAGPGLINCGCYVLGTRELDRWEVNTPFSFESDFLTQNVKIDVVSVFKTMGSFIDIGIPEDYERAKTKFKDAHWV